MTRWLLGFAGLTLLACSSTSVNEGSGGVAGGGAAGSSGASSGGASSGGASSGGTSSGGSGATGGGGLGGGVACNLTDCLTAIAASPCKAKSCLPGCAEATQYATCACKGEVGCSYPLDNAAAKTLIECVAGDAELAVKCLGVPACVPGGQFCGNSTMKCCPGTTCVVDTCVNP